MANAPRPGVGRRREQQAAATTEMTLRVLDDEWSFCPAAIPFAIRAKVRKSTGGIPFAAYMNEDAFDIDSLMVCVWVARMVSGEPDLTISDVESSVDWASLGEDDIDVTVTDPGDDGEPAPND